MKNTIIINETIKIIDSTLKGKNGYTFKNALLVEIAKKSISMKIGCQFVLDSVSFGNSASFETIDGDYEKNIKPSQILDVKTISNFLLNLSLCFDDRCFFCFLNDSNQLCIIVLHKKRMIKNVFVSDKNSNIEASKKVFNSITQKMEIVTTKTNKNKRLIEEKEISLIKTAFNSMLGVGFNKPIVIVEKKTA